jgi:hypothetical protein
VGDLWKYMPEHIPTRHYQISDYVDFLDSYLLAVNDGIHSRFVVPSNLGKIIEERSNELCSEQGVNMSIVHMIGGSVIRI